MSNNIAKCQNQSGTEVVVPRLIRVWPDLAEMLQVTRNRAYELVARGDIPHVRLGESTIRVPVDAVDDYIQQRTVRGY